MKKSWVQAGVLVLAIFGGLVLIKRIRTNRVQKVMGQTEANILANRLNSESLSQAEIDRITSRLAAAGWKPVGEKAVRV